MFGLFNFLILARFFVLFLTLEQMFAARIKRTCVFMWVGKESHLLGIGNWLDRRQSNTVVTQNTSQRSTNTWLFKVEVNSITTHMFMPNVWINLETPVNNRHTTGCLPSHTLSVYFLLFFLFGISAALGFCPFQIVLIMSKVMNSLRALGSCVCLIATTTVPDKRADMVMKRRRRKTPHYFPTLSHIIQYTIHCCNVFIKTYWIII